MMNLESLVAIALITSVVSMLLSCAALWPHSKDGMASIRDAILWGGFIFMLAGAATVGWNRLNSTGTPMPWSPVANQSESLPFGSVGSVPYRNSAAEYSDRGAPPKNLNQSASYDRRAIQPTFQTKSRPANKALYGVDTTNSAW